MREYEIKNIAIGVVWVLWLLGLLDASLLWYVKCISINFMVKTGWLLIQTCSNCEVSYWFPLIIITVILWTYFGSYSIADREKYWCFNLYKGAITCLIPIRLHIYKRSTAMLHLYEIENVKKESLLNKLWQFWKIS